MANNNKPKAVGGVVGPGGGRGMMPGEKPKDFRGSIGKIIKYMQKSLPVVLFALLLAIVSVLASINVPNILGQATDEIITGVTKMTLYDNIKPVIDKMGGAEFKTMNDFVQATKDMQGSAKMLEQIPEKYRSEILAMSLLERPRVNSEKVKSIIFSLAIIVIASGLFNYLQGFLLAGVAQRTSYNLRRDIKEKLARLPLKYFDTNTTGEVMSHITNDVDTISTTLSQSLSQLTISVVTVFGVLFMMLRIDLLMTLSSLIILPMSLWFIAFIVKKSQKYFKAQQDNLGHVNGHIEEMYSGHTVVQLYGRTEQSRAEFIQHNNALAANVQKSQFLSGLMMPIMNFFSNISYLLICVLGGYLSISGRITIGNIQAFIQYMRQFNQPIAQMATIVNTLQSTAAAAERVFKLLEAPQEEETGTAQPKNISGNMRFENVSFGYSAEKIIIKDFSAVVKAGERVAIVGPTGAGKTTIVKLLMRFYELNSGKILLEEQDITGFRRSELREEFGMVLQDTWLSNKSILENIRYGRLNATDDEVYEAAKSASAHHFIKTLPEGYNFIIDEEGSNISAGQKQLLTIARAILRDPKLLILDEATSSVDTRTELLIQKAMLKLMQGRTSFVIAHRLSTIRDADIILVMQDGDIVEQGNHTQLIEQKGFYYNLYNSQFKNNTEGRFSCVNGR